MTNNQQLLLHRFEPQPINLIPKQETVKIHAFALLSMMTNANTTVLLYNLLHRGYSESTATDVQAWLIFQHLCDQLSALLQDFFRTNVQFQDFLGPEFSVSENQDFLGPVGTLNMA